MIYFPVCSALPVQVRKRRRREEAIDLAVNLIELLEKPSIFQHYMYVYIYIYIYIYIHLYTHLFYFILMLFKTNKTRYYNVSL